MADSLHRIYQGRVNSLELKSGDEWASASTDLLYAHHELFQDAVNYYLLALAAMASDPNSPVGKLKQRMTETWDDFTRKGQLRNGMKRSLARTFQTTPEALFFDVACAKILTGNTTPPEILQLAVNLVGEKCAGDSGIQQQGPTYFPRLCNADYKGKWDFGAKAGAAAVGMSKLSAALNACNPLLALQNIQSEITLDWAGVATQTDKYFEDDEAREQIKRAIAHFRNLGQKYRKPTISQYLDSTSDLVEILETYEKQIAAIASPRIEKNNKTDLNRLNAFILLKFFPDTFTVGLMKTIPLGEKSGSKKKDAATPALAYDNFGDDPVNLSRSSRGFVFPAFSALPIFNSVWKPFDIEAFKEALKTINQFNQKTSEREKKKAEVQAILDWMDGKSSKCPSADKEGDNDDPVGVLGSDPRWKKLQTILKSLEVTNELTDGETKAYGLRQRTIRGFDSLRQEWQKILDKNEKNTSAKIKDDLEKKLNKHQTDHRDDMGSSTLFLKLIEPQNWDIWRLHEGEAAAQTAKNHWSQNLLNDAVIYFDAQQDIADLSEPINFTPADPQLSRRLCNLSALGSWAGKEFGHDSGSLTCRIPLAVKNETGKWEPRTAKIHYTAPRLLRDGLRQNDKAENLSATNFLPPMAQHLAAEPNQQDFLTCALQLMPDWDAKGKLRILLNFPITIEVNHLQSAIAGQSRWNKQFVFSNDKNTMLLWPSTDDKKRATWFNDKSPFQVLSVDLGQRTAAATTVIEVTPTKPTQKHTRPLGSAGGSDWYARRTHAELLRLPGEDVQVWRGGKQQTEFSGSKGRKASDTETTDAIALCNDFGQDPAFLLDPTLNLSFPEQNDKLIVAARRAQSKLARLNRWIWMLSEPAKRADALKSIREFEEYKEIPESSLPIKLRHEEAELREKLPGLLLQLTNRILPLRGRTWKFTEHPQTGIKQAQKSFLLQQTEPGTDTDKKDICGQRGLSFARIEQLEELRKRWQSLNRALMRTPGDKPESARQMRDNQIPDPCPDILRRLDAMREQRVNQTAHLIVASALGVQLKKHDSKPEEREITDIHGEYEPIPGRSPVAFIVLEDLSRYLSSQGRSPSENSRLMKWSHRAVTDKVKMLCEPFGIQVLQVNAAFSSRFCSATGIPGFRAVELSAADKSRFPWSKLLADENKSEEARECKALFSLLDANPGKTLLAPKAGGEIFVPAKLSDLTTQADINAAFNIGIRALAEPSQFHVHPRVRAEKKNAQWSATAKTKFDSARFNKGETVDYTPSEADKKEQASKSVMNFFYDQFGVANYDKATCKKLPLATNKGLWGSVKDSQWRRCMEINRIRLAKNNKDIIPM